MTQNNLDYRPCVGVTVFNPQGLVFIGRRQSKGAHDIVETPYLWQMPQGGIDENETAKEAAVRELYEETNISSITYLTETPNWLQYDLPTESTQRWKGKYRGQTQRWFAFLFTGSENEINILSPGQGNHAPEFDAWRWEKLAALPELVVPFKRQVYEQVVELFMPLTAR